MTDELKDRVSTLEATVKREAWARAKMDEDLSALKIQFMGQDRLLKALSSTQSEHTATLRALRQEVNGIRQEVNGIRQDVNGIRQEVNEVRQDVTEIRIGIGMIIDKIDRLDEGGGPGRGLPEQRRE